MYGSVRWGCQGEVPLQGDFSAEHMIFNGEDGRGLGAEGRLGWGLGIGLGWQSKHMGR